VAFRAAVESVLGQDRVYVPSILPQWYIGSIAHRVRERAVTVDGAVAMAESLGDGVFSLYQLASGVTAPLSLRTGTEKPLEAFMEFEEFQG
jgi:hypothetical protein